MLLLLSSRALPVTLRRTVNSTSIFNLFSGFLLSAEIGSGDFLDRTRETVVFLTGQELIAS